MTYESERRARMERVKEQLALHAGHKPWGRNDGSLKATLEAHGLHPTDFLESLDGWGYEIRIAGMPSETDLARAHAEGYYAARYLYVTRRGGRI